MLDTAAQDATFRVPWATMVLCALLEDCASTATAQAAHLALLTTLGAFRLFVVTLVNLPVLFLVAETVTLGTGVRLAAVVYVLTQ